MTLGWRPRAGLAAGAVDIQHRDVVRLATRAPKHGIAKERRVRRDNDLTLVLHGERREQLRDQLEAPWMDAVLGFLECQERPRPWVRRNRGKRSTRSVPSEAQIDTLERFETLNREASKHLSTPSETISSIASSRRSDRALSGKKPRWR
jgi:hypothetical protein